MHPGSSGSAAVAHRQTETRARVPAIRSTEPLSSDGHRGQIKGSLPARGADFRYAYFRRLLQAAKNSLRTHRLSEALDVLPNTGTSILFLRHDLKCSLYTALRMATIEREYDIRATYMVRSDSPLYSLTGRQARHALNELLGMGHEIGLHFDLAHATGRSPFFLRLVEAEIQTACERLEQIIGRPVRSLSFQRAIPLLFDGPLLINGRINADAHELRAWCVSDSGGTWQGGEPTAQFARAVGPALQFILHPIWWGDEHQPAPQRLQAFFEVATREKSPSEAGLFDINLAKTLPEVRRQSISALMSGGR